MTNYSVKEDSDRNEESAGSFNVLGAIQALHSASEPFFTQVKLHSQLLSLEWAEEKQRLSKMFVTLLVGYAFFICFLLFIGILVLTLSWDTRLNVIAIATLCALYGVATYVAWNKFSKLAKTPERLFSSTRKELLADIALIVSKLS